jgi:hypothetical protein|tara:strand:- start:514 stop:735 length:222 start_codon:yes stop_codon:yes gene_type:complete
MSTWQLLCGEEVIDTVSLKTDNYEEAHTYFRLRKNLDNDTFNKLFLVKEYTRPQKPIGNVEWWKSEPNKLDDF